MWPLHVQLDFLLDYSCTNTLATAEIQLRICDPAVSKHPCQPTQRPRQQPRIMMAMPTVIIDFFIFFLFFFTIYRHLRTCLSDEHNDIRFRRAIV